VVGGPADNEADPPMRAAIVRRKSATRDSNPEPNGF
jgi:hypothetical protein